MAPRTAVFELTQHLDLPAVAARLREALEAEEPWLLNRAQSGEGMNWLGNLLLMLSCGVTRLVVAHERKTVEIAGVIYPYGRRMAQINWGKTWTLLESAVKLAAKEKRRVQQVLSSFCSTLQGLKSEIRGAAVCRSGAKDLDMKSCHLSIVLSLLGLLGRYPVSAHTLKTDKLRYVVENKDEVIRAINECVSCESPIGDPPSAKVIVGMLPLYMKRGATISERIKRSNSVTIEHVRLMSDDNAPIEDFVISVSGPKSPFALWKTGEELVEWLDEFCQEMQLARKHLLGIDRFPGLPSTVSGKRALDITNELIRRGTKLPHKREGTAFSYLLAEVENMLLEGAAQACKASPQSLIFDGMIVVPALGTTDDDLVRQCEASGPKYKAGQCRGHPLLKHVKWTVKSFEKRADGSPWMPPEGTPIAWSQADAAPYERQFLEHFAPRPPEAWTPGMKPGSTYCEARAAAFEWPPAVDGKQTVVACEAMGSGKTHQTRLLVQTALQHRGTRVLIVLPRVSLVRETVNRMRALLPAEDVAFYQDFIDEWDEFMEKPCQVIQIDSVYRVASQRYNLVVIDESELIAVQLLSSRNDLDNHVALSNITRDTPRLLVMDALVGPRTFQLVENAVRPLESLVVRHNTFEHHADRGPGLPRTKFYVHRGDDSARPALQAALEAGKKVFVACTSVRQAHALMELAVTKWGVGQETVRYIPGVDRLDGPDAKAERDKHLDDMNVATEEARLVIVTPCVIVGNSIDWGVDGHTGGIDEATATRAFDVAFAFVCPGVCGYREVLQMLHRCRLLRDRVMHVELDSKFGKDPRTDLKSCMRRMTFVPTLPADISVATESRRELTLMVHVLLELGLKVGLHSAFEYAGQTRYERLETLGDTYSKLDGRPVVHTVRDLHAMGISLPEHGLLHLWAIHMAEHQDSRVMLPDQLCSVMAALGAECIQCGEQDAPAGDAVDEERTAAVKKRHRREETVTMLTQEPTALDKLAIHSRAYDSCLTQAQQRMGEHINTCGKYGLTPDHHRCPVDEQAPQDAIAHWQKLVDPVHQRTFDDLSQLYGRVDAPNTFDGMLNACDAGMCSGMQGPRNAEYGAPTAHWHRIKTALAVLSKVGAARGPFHSEPIPAETVAAGLPDAVNLMCDWAAHKSSNVPRKQLDWLATACRRFVQCPDYEGQTSMIKTLNERLLYPCFQLRLIVDKVRQPPRSRKKRKVSMPQPPPPSMYALNGVLHGAGSIFTLPSAAAPPDSSLAVRPVIGLPAPKPALTYMFDL